MLNINATLVAIVINFIILVYILNYFLYKPVLKILEDRKLLVDEALAGAEAKMDSAKAFMDEGRAALNKANMSARGIIDDASAAAEKIRKESMARAKKEIEEQKLRAKEEIRQYKVDAKRSIINEAAKLSVLIAEKLIVKKIDKKSQRSIVDNFIERIRN